MVGKIIFTRKLQKNILDKICEKMEDILDICNLDKSIKTSKSFRSWKNIKANLKKEHKDL